MVSAITLDQKGESALLAACSRFSKSVELAATNTPPIVNLKTVRIFRASGLSKMCSVEAAFAVQLWRDKSIAQLQLWVQKNQLPVHLTPIVDTGTVVHKQLQYYSGLIGYAIQGQWRCPACGFYTHKKTSMPTTAKPLARDGFEGLTGLYPAPCPRCKKNLEMFPPWLYVEPAFLEEVKDVPPPLRVSGHVDCIWHIKVPIDKSMVNIPVLVDFKTINKAGFEGKLWPLPSPDHVIQVQVYLELSKLSYGLIIYYCKDNSTYKLFLVKRSPEVWNLLQKRVNWARSGDLTEKEKYRECTNIGHPRSRSCFFQEQCWGTKAPVNIMA